MSTISQPIVLQNSSNSQNSGRLLKNIKNSQPITTNLKKSDKTNDTTTNGVKKSASQGNSTKKVNSGLLFTPINSVTQAKSKEEEELQVLDDFLPQNTSLDGIIAGIAADNVDEIILPTSQVNLADILSSTPTKPSLTIANAFEVKEDAIATSLSSSSKIVYTSDFLLSLKSQFTKKPLEIDFIITNQSEIVLPTKLTNTPFVQKQQHFNPLSTPKTAPRSTQPYNSPLNSPTFKNQQHQYYSTPFSSHNFSQKSPISIPFQLPTQPASALKKLTFTPKNNNSNNNNNKPKTPKSVIKFSPLTSDEPVNPIVASITAKDTKVSEITTVATPTTNELIIDGASASTATTATTVQFKKPRETDVKRLAARQRQIDLGKMTAGFKNFITTVPKSARKQTDPKAPNIYQICSKRSWDGQIRKWRRLLHQYDPEAPKIDEEEIKQLTSNEGLTEDEIGEFEDDEDDKENSNQFISVNETNINLTKD